MVVKITFDSKGRNLMWLKIMWDGRDSSGNAVKDGLYTYVIHTPEMSLGTAVAFQLQIDTQSQSSHQEYHKYKWSRNICRSSGKDEGRVEF